MSHPLDGIREKLKRADQCIRNLDYEISLFLAKFPTFEFPIMRPGVDPVFSDQQADAWKKFGLDFLKAERENPVPLRFPVLTGEIVHHLRSCFDHLIWQLSSVEARKKFRSEIEFPVCLGRQECVWSDIRKEFKHSAYCRKIKGITSITALAIIDSLQPNPGSDPFDSLLWRIHDMDITDKHRELAIVISAPGARLEGTGLRRWVTVYKAGIPIGEIPLPGILNMKVNTKIAGYVAFDKPVKGEFEPIIKVLEQFLDFTTRTINSFAGEFV